MFEVYQGASGRSQPLFVACVEATLPRDSLDVLSGVGACCFPTVHEGEWEWWWQAQLNSHSYSRSRQEVKYAHLNSCCARSNPHFQTRRLKTSCVRSRPHFSRDQILVRRNPGRSALNPHFAALRETVGKRTGPQLSPESLDIHSGTGWWRRGLAEAGSLFLMT